MISIHISKDYSHAKNIVPSIYISFFSFNIFLGQKYGPIWCKAEFGAGGGKGGGKGGGCQAVTGKRTCTEYKGGLMISIKGMKEKDYSINS